MTTATFAPTLPGPRSVPILGRTGNTIQFFRDPIAYLRHSYQTYGDLVGLIEGDKLGVFAFGPEYNHYILTNPDLFNSPSMLLFPASPDSAARRLDAGLLSMNGAHHRQQRKLIMPAFHKKHVETYRDDMVAITQQMLDTWRPKQQLDIAHEMQQLTLRIVSRTLFGLDAGQNTQHIGLMSKQWLAFLTSPQVMFLPHNLPGMPYRRALAHAERMEANLRNMIARKRANPAEQHDVIAMLIQTRDEDGTALTDAELIGQANILFLAGHETSSNALTWTLFLLAQHPAIAADLLDELKSELHGDPPTIEQLGKLPLLERVVKESMRILPPAVYAVRNNTAPFALGPYEFNDPGIVVGLSHYITHHMPELYPEPERFNPGRWNNIDPSPYEYLPFSAGPRMCIGATFALMEIKLVLATLLQRYRFALQPNARIDRHVAVTLTPRQGMPMTVMPQDRQFQRSLVHGNIHEMVYLQ
ncbi:MAG: cytochrome P450 [Chloroflexales bacterium]|nr:cytochrome P450 [Chloroflexales bacterium]